MSVPWPRKKNPALSLPPAILTEDAIEQGSGVCLVVFVGFGIPLDLGFVLRNNHHIRPGCLESGKGGLLKATEEALLTSATLFFAVRAVAIDRTLIMWLVLDPDLDRTTHAFSMHRHLDDFNLEGLERLTY